MKKMLLFLLLIFIGCKTWGRFYESAKITNLPANGLLNSGFLIGTAPSGSVKSVRVSIDGGSYSDATGTIAWKFKLPTGSSTLRETAMHYAKISLKYSDDTEIESATVNFRKGVNKDINGDGYPDYVITAQNRNSAQGAAYVFYTNTTGLPQSPLSANAILTGIASGDSFGNGVQLGDINGDGFGDIVVMANTRNSNTGEVYIFYPTPSADGYSATIGTISAANAGTILTGEATGDNFGASMAISDLNADGYADLLASAHTKNSSQGRTYLFAGASGKILTGNVLAVSLANFNGESTGDTSGVALYAGDMNGDNFSDFIIGANGNAGTGAVYVFYGTGSFPVTQGLGTANAKISGQSASDAFGGYVCITDLNNDGNADLVVGASGRNSVTGASYIFYGSGVKLTSRSASAANTIINGISAGDYFSNAFPGDFNNDGYNDLVIGAYLRNAGAGTQQGSGYIFLSSASGITATSALNANATFNGISAGDNFGGHFRVVDVNQDGYADLIAGAFSRNAGAGASQGAAYIFLSGPSGISSANPANASAVLNGLSAGDQFGARTE